MASYSTPPKKEESEITLIGTGGGYGECVIIKGGENNWIVVDSCINPKTKKSLPIEYLEEVGVNIKNDVKLIICTHWHDDHIKGLADLLDIADNAKFCFAKATDGEKFLLFVSLDYKKASKSSNSTTLEFNRCIEIAKDKKRQLVSAVCDKPLFRDNFSVNKFEVIALSPSDQTLNDFDTEISKLITDFGEHSNKQIVINTPNDKSIAILIKLGEEIVILGSDLEATENPQKGWLHVINHSIEIGTLRAINKKSTLFKIPHHGSENGYHDDIWHILLNDKPISKITPWNKNKKLPQAEMITKYKGMTDKLYITSNRFFGKPKKRESLDKSIEKFIKAERPSLEEVKFHLGIVRSRIDHSNDSPTWNTELFGAAALL